MKNAEWISDNPKVMKIDKYGIGTAISEGDANIILKEKNSQKIITSTLILVRKIYKVSFDKAKLPKSFSDIKKNGVEFINKYEVSPILYTSDDEVFTRDETDKLSIINHKIKVECDSDFPYYVKADQVNKDNNNLCIFTIRENKYSDSKKKGWNKEEKPKDINIQLTVKDYYGNKNSVQESIPFSSSFKIKNDIHTINLSYKEREYYIYVDNLNDLDIKISNEKLVKIEEINKNKKYIKIKIPYTIDDEFRGVVLYLANVLTGQKEEIIINYNNSGASLGAGGSVNSITDYIFVIVLTCLLLFIAYFLIFSDRKNPNLAIPNMNYNNTSYNNNLNYNNNSQNYFSGKGYPINNINNNYGNNQEYNYLSGNKNNFESRINNNFNYTNNGGFINNMRSNNYGQQPRGSTYNYSEYRPNIDMKGAF